jgi:hypothetical protein
MKTLLLALLCLSRAGWGQTSTFRMQNDDWRKCHGAVEHDKDGYYCAIVLVPPEPMDIPAISEAYPACEHYSLWSWGIKCDKPIIGHAPTCADTRRILLTAEDGSKHCINFQANGASWGDYQ